MVQSAPLDLCVTARDSSGNSLKLDAYPLLRTWAESDVTWNAPWSSPGANAVGVDRAGEIAASAVLTPADVGHCITLDVTALAQSWINDPAANWGLILRSTDIPTGGIGGYQFATSEHWDVAQRPQLTVIVDANATLTPTATPPAGPTATLTATPAGAADYATTELGDAWDFNEGDQENISYWSAGITSHAAAGGALNLTTTAASSPYFWWNGLNIATGTYHRLKIRLQAGSGTALKVHVHTYTPTGAYIGYCYAGQAAAGQWVLLEQELAGRSCWTGGAVGRLRIGFDQVDRTIQIDDVRVENSAVAQGLRKVRGLAALSPASIRPAAAPNPTRFAHAEYFATDPGWPHPGGTATVENSVLRLEPEYGYPGNTVLSVAPWRMTTGHLKGRGQAVSSDNPAYWQNAQIVFDYQDVNNYKFAGLRVGGGRWVIGAVADGVETILADSTVAPPQVDNWYALDVVVTHDRVTLYVADQERVSWQPAGAHRLTGGQVGLKAKQGIAEFQELELWDVGRPGSRSREVTRSTRSAKAAKAGERGRRLRDLCASRTS